LTITGAGTAKVSVAVTTKAQAPLQTQRQQ